MRASLCHATRVALDGALAEARAGAPINRIGRAVERVARAHGFRVIRNLAGHGVGRKLHEEPEGIVSYYDQGDGRRLRLGQVIAIEPFLSTRSAHTSDGSGRRVDARQAPGSRSAQFEHTIIVTNGEPIVATRSERERLTGRRAPSDGVPSWPGTRRAFRRGHDADLEAEEPCS